MIDERDELIGRVAGALKPLPQQNARAMAQILVALRARPAQAGSVIGSGPGGAPPTPDERILPTAASPSASVPAIAAANAPNEVRAVPVPITFDAADAKSVSIVGDFND